MHFSKWLRPGRLVAGLALLIGSNLQADDGVTPKAFPADRYSKMASHSPFAPPTAPIATPPPVAPPPQPSFADRLTAISIAVDKGIYMVMVVDQDTQEHNFLRSDRLDAKQMQIASVRWDANGDKSQVPVITVRKGGLTGQVRYEPTTAAAGAPGMGGGPAIPGSVPRLNNGAVPPAARPYTPPIMPGGVPNPVAAVPGVPNAPAIPGSRAPIRGPQQVTQPPPATGGRAVVMPGNQPTVRPGVISPDDDDDDDD